MTEINAPPREKIKIVLTTISNLPKVAMAHNVVMLKSDTDIEAFANASATARNNNYIAPEFKEQVIAATLLAGGDETVEITFTSTSKSRKISLYLFFSRPLHGRYEGNFDHSRICQ